MKLPRFYSCILALFAITLQSIALEIEGVHVPESQLLPDGSSLVLNGAGVRKKLMFKLYIGALYLAEKSQDAEAIVAAETPMAIELQIISGKINSDNMTKATTEGFEHSTEGKTDSIQAEIQQFLRAFSEPIVKGDKFTMTYIPGDGVIIQKNAKTVDTISDTPGFKEALFGIWLSAHPAQDSLKSAMLGNEE